MDISRGSPSLPIGASKNWMLMGTFTPQMGADGVWTYGYPFKVAKIELFYFDDNFRHKAQWVPPLRVADVSSAMGYLPSS